MEIDFQRLIERREIAEIDSVIDFLNRRSRELERESRRAEDLELSRAILDMALVVGVGADVLERIKEKIL